MKRKKIKNIRKYLIDIFIILLNIYIGFGVYTLYSQQEMYKTALYTCAINNQTFDDFVGHFDGADPSNFTVRCKHPFYLYHFERRNWRLYIT